MWDPREWAADKAISGLDSILGLFGESKEDHRRKREQAEAESRARLERENAARRDREAAEAERQGEQLRQQQADREFADWARGPGSVWRRISVPLFDPTLERADEEGPFGGPREPGFDPLEELTPEQVAMFEGLRRFRVDTRARVREEERVRAEQERVELEKLRESAKPIFKWVAAGGITALLMGGCVGGVVALTGDGGSEPATTLVGSATPETEADDGGAGGAGTSGDASDDPGSVDAAGAPTGGSGSSGDTGSSDGDPGSSGDAGAPVGGTGATGEATTTTVGSESGAPTSAAPAPGSKTATVVSRRTCYGDSPTTDVRFATSAPAGTAATLLMSISGEPTATRVTSTVGSGNVLRFVVPVPGPGRTLRVASLDIGGDAFDTNFGSHTTPDADDSGCPEAATTTTTTMPTTTTTMPTTTTMLDTTTTTMDTTTTTF